jgi:hypothetical protein
MGEERRRHPRYESEFTVAIEPTDSDYAHFRDVARLHDISNSGLSFASSRSDLYEPGQHLKITILPPDDATDSGVVVHALATIVWVSELQPKIEGVQVGVSLDEWIDATALAG